MAKIKNKNNVTIKGTEKQLDEIESINHAPVFRDIMFKRTFIYAEHCNFCGERLSGDNSIISPFKCSCGTWRYINNNYEVHPLDPIEYYQNKKIK